MKRRPLSEQMTIEENDRDSDNLFIPDATWRADDHIGFLLGISARIDDAVDLTLEGRFVDETAFSARLRYRF